MSPVLTIAERRQGAADILSLKGRMDATTSPEAEAHLTHLLDGGSRIIIVDLADLEYISSAGLRVLLAALKRLKQSGGELRLASLQPEIRKVFEIAGFHRLFPLYPGVAEVLLPSGTPR